jgi:hypothetical protein
MEAQMKDKTNVRWVSKIFLGIVWVSEYEPLRVSLLVIP